MEKRGENNTLIKDMKDLRRGLNPRKDHRFFGQQPGADFMPLRHYRKRCDVAGMNILGKGIPDDSVQTGHFPLLPL
jgi:hypothetical protein